MIQIPGYLIKREIGSGGMATVYLAVQMSLEREVALKVMNPALVSDPNFSRRFLTEARTLASLSHPNIVAVYDVGVSESQLHYFSMQHLPGGDFAKRIKLGATQAEVLRVLAGVARALGFAHARGFVHRDVSPANVLFDASDGPILTDFGIARAVTRTSRLTNAGVSVGTSHYMSPEQARGGNVDARSDIYSLGAVAFEALTGKPPYDGEDGFAIAYAHVFEPIPRLPPTLAHWQALIDQALAKHPNERFVDLDGFLNALDVVAGAVGMPPVTGQQRAVPQNATMVFSAADMPAAVPVTQQFAQMPPIDEATRAMPIPVAAPAPAATPTFASANPAPARASDAEARPAAPPRRFALVAAAVVVLGLTGLALALFFGGKEDGSPAVAATTPAPAETPAAATLDPATALAAVDATPTPTPTPTTQAPPELPATGDVSGDVTASDAYGDAYASESPYPAEDGMPADAAIEATPEEAAVLKAAIDTTAVDPLATTLALARYDLAAKRLALPPGRNALDRNRLALKLAERFKSPSDVTRAKQGIVDTATAYLDLAEEKLAQNKETEFLDYLARGGEIAASLPEGAEVAKRAKQRREQLRDAQLELARVATGRWDKAAALAAYQKALVFDPQSAAAKKGVAAAGKIGEPGFAFRDALKGGGQAPEMIVVQAGGKKIAAARTETTLAEFRRFASAGSLGTRPGCRDREGFFRRAKDYESADVQQDGTHPVVCVSWDDADRYAKWLSQQSGKRYRLPSESEWTALARGADRLAACRANLADRSYATANKERDAFDCDDGFAGTAPVRRFDATPAGVYDIAGNAREWVGDCAGCGKHTAMGSSWFTRPKDSADPLQRDAFNADVASNTVGFRVVRDVD